MNIKEYIKESYIEFKEHVTWPSWSELQQDTIIVGVATIILAVFLFAIDSLFGNVIIKNLFELLR